MPQYGYDGEGRIILIEDDPPPVEWMPDKKPVTDPERLNHDPLKFAKGE